MALQDFDETADVILGIVNNLRNNPDLSGYISIIDKVNQSCDIWVRLFNEKISDVSDINSTDEVKRMAAIKDLWQRVIPRQLKVILIFKEGINNVFNLIRKNRQNAQLVSLLEAVNKKIPDIEQVLQQQLYYIKREMRDLPPFYASVYKEAEIMKELQIVFEEVVRTRTWQENLSELLQKLKPVAAGTVAAGLGATAGTLLAPPAAFAVGCGLAYILYLKWVFKVAEEESVLFRLSRS